MLSRVHHPSTAPSLDSVRSGNAQGSDEDDGGHLNPDGSLDSHNRATSYRTILRFVEQVERQERTDIEFMRLLVDVQKDLDRTGVHLQFLASARKMKEQQKQQQKQQQNQQPRERAAKTAARSADNNDPHKPPLPERPTPHAQQQARNFSAYVDMKESAEVKAKMKNVLLAYGHRNRDVGYCQGMNHIVAMLLSVLDEEDAFWALATVVEYLFPETYLNSLIGVRRDQLVLYGIFEKRFPAMLEHLESLGLTVSALVVQWLISIFIDCFPPLAVFRLFDAILSNVEDGPSTIRYVFGAAIAVFSSIEQQLLQTASCVEASNVVSAFCKSETASTDAFFVQIWEETAALSVVRIQEMRAHHRQQLLDDEQEMEQLDADQAQHEGKLWCRKGDNKTNSGGAGGIWTNRWTVLHGNVLSFEEGVRLQAGSIELKLSHSFLNAIARSKFPKQRTYELRTVTPIFAALSQQDAPTHMKADSKDDDGSRHALNDCRCLQPPP
jgi:hypothetical protein